MASNDGLVGGCRLDQMHRCIAKLRGEATRTKQEVDVNQCVILAMLLPNIGRQRQTGGVMVDLAYIAMRGAFFQLYNNTSYTAGTRKQVTFGECLTRSEHDIRQM